MFDPIAYFHDRIGEPVGRWVVENGLDMIALVLGTLLGFGVIVISVLAVVDLIFGLGIFSNDSGCPAPDPYDPVFEGDC